MSSKLVVQVEPERLELRLRGVSALAAGTVYAPVVLEGAGGAVAPVLRLFRDETCADAVAWTSEPASPVPHHSRLMSFPSLRLDTEATLDWFSDARDAKTLPSSARVWGWLVAVDMGNGSDVGPVVLGASRVPVLLHDFSPVETDPGDSWSSVLSGLVAEAVSALGTRVSALEANTYSKSDVDGIVAALKTGSRQIVASLSAVVSPQPMVIYMVAKSAGQTGNVYDEYIWAEVGGVGQWEKIGDTEIDLSGYVQKESGKGLSTNDYTVADKTKLAGIAAGAQVNVIETVKVNGTALTPSGKAVNVPIPSTTQTLAQEEYDSVGNSVTVDVPRQRNVKLKIRNVLSNTVNTLDTSASGTIATREWVQQEIDVPSPSDADPAANGTAWEGESDNYSRADHVHPTDTTRQSSITASGILKGNGSGGVTAAVAGTDYQAPLSAYTSTPSAPTVSGSAGSSTEYARGDHVHPAETLVVTATLNLANMTVGNLSHTFAQILAARQAGRNVLLEATAPLSATAGARMLAWCSTEFGSVSGQSLQIGQLWFSAFMYTGILGDGNHTYYGAVVLEYDGTATLYLNQLVAQGDDIDMGGGGDSSDPSTLEDSAAIVFHGPDGVAYQIAFGALGAGFGVYRIDSNDNVVMVNPLDGSGYLYPLKTLTTPGAAGYEPGDHEVSRIPISDGTQYIAVVMPAASVIDGARDFVVDIDNTQNSDAVACEPLGIGTGFMLLLPAGKSAYDLAYVEAGKYARLYFSETSLKYYGMPVIAAHRLDLELLLSI